VRKWVADNMNLENKDKDKPKDDKTAPPNPQESEARKTLVDDKLISFEKRFSLDKMESDKKKDFSIKLAQTVWEAADPEGKYKTWDEVTAHIPLNKLDRYLENAYYLLTKDDVMSKLSDAGVEGAFPSFSSSSLPTSEINLTAAEKAAAKGMHISEDKYLAQKKKMGGK